MENIDEFREKLLRIYHPAIVDELFQFKKNSFRIKAIDESIIMFKAIPEKKLIKILRVWLKYMHNHKMLKWFVDEYGDRIKGQISIKEIVEEKMGYTSIEFFGDWYRVKTKSNENLIPLKTNIPELEGDTFVYALEQVLREIREHARID